MKKTITTVILFMILVPNYSQDHCDNLIKQGIRSYTRSKTYTNDYSLTKQKIKEIYDEFKKDLSTANASAKLKGIFKGKANYSREEIESLYKLYWSEDLNISEVTRQGSFESTYVDENFVRLYEACQKGKQNNISLIINSTDNKLNSISIKTEVITIAGHSIPKITSINYDSTKLNVEGTLLIASKKQSKVNKVLTLKVERIDINPKDSVWFNNKYVLAKPTQLIINFNTYSSTINFPVVELPKKENILKKGVGEIVASILDKDVFIKLYGDNWMLANGDPAPENSAYYKYTKQFLPHMKEKLPDLRGVFLRGLNNGLSMNPDNSEIGQLQEDAIRNITGSFLASNPNQGGVKGAFRSEHFQSGDKNEWHGNHSNVKIFFDASRVVKTSTENRPKNVTVNYFIKIN